MGSTAWMFAMLATLGAGGCRKDGQAEATTGSPAAADAAPAPAEATEAAGEGDATEAPAEVPAVLIATVQLPSPADARWLNATITAGPDGWFMSGCESAEVGVCRWNPRFALDDDERREYARRIALVRAMPRCEPVAFGPNDFPFDLELDDDHRSAHIPHQWFPMGDDAGPPNDDSDPCRAEVRLAWWIYETFDRHGRATSDAAGDMSRCSAACCSAAERVPDPTGAIECCFCGSP
ncbi:MAG: hypothetical protein HY825_16785 [Acidobacteria bacterium]|nr:hypothetical protein [Acidobacteriota bacterium]